MEIRGRIGKAESQLSAIVTRELEAADLVIRESMNLGIKAPGIKALRAKHHQLAQCLAQGYSDTEASVTTGYSPSRISILKADPAFKDLLAFYQESSKDAFVDVQSRMAGFAVTCVEVLQDRIEDRPDSFTNKDLNELIKTTADRGGHSPVHKTENKTVLLTAQDLKSMKEEVETKQNGQVRKINQSEEAQRVKTLVGREKGEGLEGGDRAEVGSNDNRSASDILIPTPPTGEQGERDNV